MLHFHAGENHVQKLRTSLITGDEDVDDLDGNGWTALHHAASAGKNALAAMQLLIDFNATLDIQNKKGDTPLHIAAQSKAMAPLGLLLTAGADLYLQNAEGDSPAAIFEREGWERALQDDIEAGRKKREDFARVKREAAEKAALERKKAMANNMKPEKEAKTQVSAQGRRAIYMALRDQLAVKMKQKKTAHQKGVSELSGALGQLWDDMKEREAREADVKAGWRTIRAAHVLEEEDSVQHQERLQKLGLGDVDMEATRCLLVCEAETAQLAVEQHATAASFAELESDTLRVEERMQGLDRLVPLLHLLRSSLLLNKDRHAVEGEQRRAYEARLEAYEQKMEEEEAQRREAEAAECRRPVVCARCGLAFTRDHSNKPTACRFHVGQKTILANFASGWSCCQRNGVGCRMAAHTTGDENAEYA